VRTEWTLCLLLLALLIGCPSGDDDDSAANDDDAADDDDSVADDDDSVADDDDAVDDDDAEPGLLMSDLAGWYQTQSVSFQDGEDLMTVTRTEAEIVFEDQPVMAFLRGWAEITANTDTAGQVTNAFGIIVEDFLVQHVSNLSPASTEDDNLVVDLDDGSQAVYGVAIDGEVVTFTALVDHPNHTTDGSPTEIIMERMKPPVAETEGAWAYDSFTYTDADTGAETVVGTDCSPYDDAWANISGGFEIMSYGNLLQAYTLQVYDNDQCNGAAVGGVSFQGPGFFDEDAAGDLFTSWVRAQTTDVEMMLVTFSGPYTLGADTLTVELTTIDVFPDGTGDLVPSAVTLTAVP